MEKTAEVALLLADDKEKHGGQGWNRTSDTGIFSPLLYRLSYLAMEIASRVLNRSQAGESRQYGGCVRAGPPLPNSRTILILIVVFILATAYPVAPVAIRQVPLDGVFNSGLKIMLR